MALKYIALAYLSAFVVPRCGLAFPEYRAELPNLPTVDGSVWPGVGHYNREGGGRRNPFGRDFSKDYSWTKWLCERDSDGDGFTNGQELGDPDCVWVKGQPPPVLLNPMTISHPGFKESTPQSVVMTPDGVPKPAGSLQNSTGQVADAAAAAAATELPSTRAASKGRVTPVSSSSSSSEAQELSSSIPSADMAIPQGSETNLAGDKPQKWCQKRAAAAAAGGSNVGRDVQWTNFSLPQMTVLGTPDLYSCHPFRIPDSIPAEREFVGVRVGLDEGAHLHHVLLMECPGDLWFLKDITRNSEMCTTHSGSMFSACNRWWIANEASNNYHMCTPPGLVYARAGEMRAHNKVLVLQVHWVFGKKLQNTSVTLGNASLELMHEAPPPKDNPTHIMETAAGTAIYPPSILQHVNGLVIPGGQDSHTADYSCSRRCTFRPLGQLSPKPVTVAGYTFHGHHYMTGMRISIKRCPLTPLPDVSWAVTDWQQSVVHPTYDITDNPIQLYPGDELSWSCTFNTSITNNTIYGGYAGYSEEMCIMLLHYYPRNALFRGCMAVERRQGGHSLCMYEGTVIIGEQSAEADRVPVRTMLSPHTLPSGVASLTSGYKASVVLFWILTITAFLWGVSLLLSKCKFLGALHKAYAMQTPQNKRSMVVYIMHILVDTAVLAAWFEPVFGGWCGCTEAGPANVWLLHFSLLYVSSAYALELVWRYRMDNMLIIHHVCTIFVTVIFAGELAPEIYRVADPIIALGVFALLEQPTFVALVLKRVLPAGNKHTTRAWVVAVWWWFASKGLSVVLAAWFIIRDWHISPSWVKGTFVGVWAIIYALQIWSGMVQNAILRSVQRDYVSLLGPNTDKAFGGDLECVEFNADSKDAGDNIGLYCRSGGNTLSSNGSGGQLSSHDSSLDDCDVLLDSPAASGGGFKPFGN